MRLQHNDLDIAGSAARTSDFTGSAHKNGGFLGAYIFLDTTSVSGTPSLDLSVEAKDPTSGTWVKIFTANTSVTATGTSTYLLYPGATNNSADVTEAQDVPLPRVWRVTVAHGTSDSVTYSIGASLIPN